MSNVLVHGMNTAWTSSAAALVVAVDVLTPPGAGGSSNLLAASSGALNAVASFTPAASLDWRAFDEIRFWIRADRVADGSITTPFHLEFFYVDAAAPGTEFRWFVPVNRSRQWEQRVIGFRTTEPRGSVTQVAFRAITPLPFSCHVAELLAVREEMLPDAESSLTREIERAAVLPGLGNVQVPAASIPASGDTQVVVAYTPGFGIGNRIRVEDSTGRIESFDVQQVIDAAPTTTTLVFGAGQAIVGPFTAPVTVSAVIPAIVETSLGPTPSPDPCVVVTMLDAREDLGRTGYFLQRDSFWAAGSLTFCSVRHAPRAYFLDYQLTVRATRRLQQLFAHELLLSRLSQDVGLRVNGEQLPIWVMPPWPLEVRRLGELSPVYVRIGTHLQIAPRSECTAVRHTEVRAAQIDAPLDWEHVEVDL